MSPIGKSPNRLLFLAESVPSTAIPQLRIFAPAEACGVEVDCVNDSNWRCDAVGNGRSDSDSLILVHRCVHRNYRRYRLLMQHAVTERIPIVYDVDDLLLKVAADHPDHRIFERAVTSTLEATLHADLITVSSEPLKDALSPFHPHIEVVPNRLPERVWETLRTARSRSLRPGDTVRLGYIGTRSHFRDLDAIAPAIRSVLLAHPSVQFVCYGFELPAVLARLPNTVAITPSKAARSDYHVYATEISQLGLDIGIAPLLDSEFNRCKSLIKMIEYGGLGVPAVYADLQPYSRGVEDGRTGLLARHEADWRAGLERLIERPDWRRAIGDAAHHCLREQWLLPAGADRWRFVWNLAAEVARSTPRTFDRPPARDLIAIARQAMAYQELTVERHRFRRKIGKVLSRISRLFRRGVARAA